MVWLFLLSFVEYTITMYDTKSRELRWNATYSDYASTLPDDDTKYSKYLLSFPFATFGLNNTGFFNEVYGVFYFLFLFWSSGFHIYTWGAFT